MIGDNPPSCGRWGCTIGLAGVPAWPERCLPELVTNARLNGHSWDQIDRALATSPSKTRLRFDPQSPVADPRWPYDI